MLYGMSYANFVLYSSVIPNYTKYEKGHHDKQPDSSRSGMTFSELVGALKQIR